MDVRDTTGERRAPSDEQMNPTECYPGGAKSADTTPTKRLSFVPPEGATNGTEVAPGVQRTQSDADSGASKGTYSPNQDQAAAVPHVSLTDESSERRGTGSQDIYPSVHENQHRLPTSRTDTKTKSEFNSKGSDSTSAPTEVNRNGDTPRAQPDCSQISENPSAPSVVGQRDCNTPAPSDSVQNKNGPAPPPDGGWGWVVMVASFFINVIIDGVSFSFGIFYIELLDYFRDTKAKTSWVGSVLNGTYLFTGPFVGVLVEMYDARVVAISGCLLAATSFFASTFSPSVEILILVYGSLGGLGFGMMFLPSILTVSIYFEKRRALATGISVCGSGVGAFVFAPLTELLINKYGWKGATWILSGIVLNGIAVSALYRPLEGPIKKYHKQDLVHNNVLDPEKPGDVIMGIKQEDKSTCLQSLRKIFDFSLIKNPVFITYGVSCLLCTICFFVPFTYLPDYAISLDISESNAALLVSIIGIANIIGRVLCGWVSDQPWADCILINSSALTIGGAATALVPLCNSFGVLAAYSAVFGASIAVFISLRSIIVVDLFGLDRLTTSFSLLTFFLGSGSLIGSPIAGAIYEVTGNYNSSFYTAGGTMILAGIL